MAEAFARFGNPSSQHAEGRAARELVDRCRAKTVERFQLMLGSDEKVEFSDIIFTSGGTEAANLALIGSALANPDSRRRRILVSAAEHQCVFGARSMLERLGYSFEVMPVDRDGVPDWPRWSLDEHVYMVVAMRVNNELGTITEPPILPEGVLWFCDAVQACGRSAERIGAAPSGRKPDLLSITAHKIGGPKGIGALYVGPTAKVHPLIAGGEQERERRGGTENTIGIAGLLGALEDLPLGPTEPSVASEAREGFWNALVAGGAIPTVPSMESNGVRCTSVQESHAHFRFPLTSGDPKAAAIDAESMLLRLDLEGIAASAGAACSSGSVEPSHVLLAIGFDAQQAKTGLRFSFSQATTVDEATRAASKVLAVYDEIRLRRQRSA